jgi:ketosteroid isomerase-like protein
LRDRYARLAAGSPEPDQQWLNWIVRRRSDAQAVGTVQATVTFAGSQPSASVAWVIGADWQGQGFASEAAGALVEWLRRKGVGDVVANIHPEHRASAAVATRAGLRRTDELAGGEQVWRAQAWTETRDNAPAMSQENEDLARFGYHWFNREHEPPPTWHPDGEFMNSREDPDHTTYRGIDAIGKQHQGWFDSYPDLRVEPLEIRSRGDRTFAWVRFTGHAANSGVPLEMELAHVGIWEDGKLRRLEEYFDRAEALAVAGLAEQPTP